MRLLDLYCKAGGAAKGYELAGFTDITGVDIEYQHHYPYTFIQGDAIEYVKEHGHEYEVIHASPPCQRYSCATVDWEAHPDLVPPTREALEASGKLYVIENVVQARLYDPLILCGTMFGLGIASDQWGEPRQLIRHRAFESNVELSPPGPCRHTHKAVTVTGTATYQKQKHWKTYNATPAEGREAMGIGWMTWPELKEAVPPAYTEWIGRQL